MRIEDKKMKIAVAGVGYVGLSNAVLLSQYNHVVAFDISKERVDMVNGRISPMRRYTSRPSFFHSTAGGIRGGRALQ